MLTKRLPVALLCLAVGLASCGESEVADSTSPQDSSQPASAPSEGAENPTPTPKSASDEPESKVVETPSADAEAAQDQLKLTYFTMPG